MNVEKSLKLSPMPEEIEMREQNGLSDNPNNIFTLSSTRPIKDFGNRVEETLNQTEELLKAKTALWQAQAKLAAQSGYRFAAWIFLAQVLTPVLAVLLFVGIFRLVELRFGEVTAWWVVSLLGLAALTGVGIRARNAFRDLKQAIFVKE